ncbi:hypothetical protein, partial [Klebsiella variicola]|uniref:hypothetical protein n=1 Tax=Klebsiella variicola TaxID=244366 RepID=UPI00195404F2
NRRDVVNAGHDGILSVPSSMRRGNAGDDADIAPGHRKDNQHNFADTVYEWTTVGEREASLGIGLDVSNLFVALRVGLSP